MLKMGCSTRSLHFICLGIMKSGKGPTKRKAVLWSLLRSGCQAYTCLKGELSWYPELQNLSLKKRFKQVELGAVLAGGKSLIGSECFSSFEVFLRHIFLVHASVKRDLWKGGIIPHVGGSGRNAGSVLYKFPFKEQHTYGTTGHWDQPWPQREQKLDFLRIQCGGLVWSNFG